MKMLCCGDNAGWFPRWEENICIIQYKYFMSQNDKMEWGHSLSLPKKRETTLTTQLPEFPNAETWEISIRKWHFRINIINKFGFSRIYVPIVVEPTVFRGNPKPEKLPREIGLTPTRHLRPLLGYAWNTPKGNRALLFFPDSLSVFYSAGGRTGQAGRGRSRMSVRPCRPWW